MIKKLRFVPMKRVWVLFLAVALLASCDEDFKVGADYKEVTVVYGLLDDGLPSNEHYIKVTKGYFSESLNNEKVAQNPDSIYFEDLDVKVEEYENGNLITTYACSRIDLNTLPDPIQKETGIFADSPNYAYNFSANLDPNRQYKLIVKNNQTGKTVSGETGIINADPFFFKVTRPFTNSDVLDFADPDNDYTFRWTAPPGAVLFDVLLRFHYDETDLNTQIKTKKSVDLPLASFVPVGNNTSVASKIENRVFYSLLTSAIGSGGNRFTRLVDTAELFILAGDNEIKQYVDVNNAQGGLTNDQIKPIFTNLTGDDVIGLFSSRATRRFGYVNFSLETYDSIISGSATRNLNFTGRSTD